MQGQVPSQVQGGKTQKTNWAPMLNPKQEVQQSSLECLPGLLPDDGGPRGAPLPDGKPIVIEPDDEAPGHLPDTGWPRGANVLQKITTDLSLLHALVQTQAGHLSRAEESIQHLKKRQRETDTEILELKTKIIVQEGSRPMSHRPPAPPPPPPALARRSLHPFPTS